MQLRVNPGNPLRGEIRVAADKSISHRAVIFAAIANGVSRIRNLSQGADVRATVNAFREMGVRIEEAGGGELEIHGVGLHGLRQPSCALDLGNSGTGMRLLAGLLCGQSWGCTLVGDASLSARPMARIIEPLRRMGAVIEAEADKPPLIISPAPGLYGIHYPMPVASAQVKSCLLLAGLYAEGETSVEEPAPTRDHTERMLTVFGAHLSFPRKRESFTDSRDPVEELGQHSGDSRVRGNDSVRRGNDSVGRGNDNVGRGNDNVGRGNDTAGTNTAGIHPGTELRATDIHVPADLSAAAFFLVGASIIPGSDIVLRGVGVNPTRNGVLPILNRMGADINLLKTNTIGGEPTADIRVRATTLHGCQIDGDDIALAIDEIPAIAVAAACADGITEIRDAAELRVKESDRISSVAAGLTALGVAVEERKDGMTITGGKIAGGRVDSHGDHRIAMAFAMAGGIASGAVDLPDCDNIATSFPDFHRVARNAGLDINVV